MKNVSTCLQKFQHKKWAEGLDIMMKASYTSILRSEPFLSDFKSTFAPFQMISSFGNESEFGHWYRYYVAILFEVGNRLTRDEALYLAQISKVDGDARLLIIGMRRELIYCTVELGEVFDDQSGDYGSLCVAYHIYHQCVAVDKLLMISLKIENFSVAIDTIFNRYLPEEFPQLLRQIISSLGKFRTAKVMIHFLRYSYNLIRREFDLVLHTDPWNRSNVIETITTIFDLQSKIGVDVNVPDLLQEIVQNRIMF